MTVDFQPLPGNAYQNAEPPNCLGCQVVAPVRQGAALTRREWVYAYGFVIDGQAMQGWLCPRCAEAELAPPTEPPDERGSPADSLSFDEIKALTRNIAQVVKRPDVGQVLSEADCSDPLREEQAVPKRKRIAAALIATNDRETELGWVDRLLDIVDKYDRARYREAVERRAEHIVELDTIRPVGRPIPGLEDDDRDVSAHVGLTYLGETGRIARHAVLLVREGNRETQIQFDLEATASAVTALSLALAELKSSRSYLERRRRELAAR